MNKQEKMEFTAKVFFIEHRGEDDYPHTDWRGQYEEMKNSVSEAFTDTVVKVNKDRLNIIEAELQGIVIQ